MAKLKQVRGRPMIYHIRLIADCLRSDPEGVLPKLALEKLSKRHRYSPSAQRVLMEAAEDSAFEKYGGVKVRDLLGGI